MSVRREDLVAYLEQVLEEVEAGRLSSVAAARIIEKMWELERDEHPNRAA